MPSQFCLSVTFLAPAFHGRGDGGEPEWPPSPLRAFQALVAAAAARWGRGRNADFGDDALRWLERLPPPMIVAAHGQTGTPFRVAVPNNDLDVVASAWSRRQEPKKQPAELKTMKTVRPTRLRDPAAVHFLWDLGGDEAAAFDAKFREVLCATARGVTHLGWGVDQVAATGRALTAEEADALPGDRWRPTAEGSGVGLRVPVAGTLDALSVRHAAFLNRVRPEGYDPVAPLPVTAFAVVGYQRPSDGTGRPFAAFELRTTDDDRFARIPPRQARDVAAMLRHAAAQAAAAAGWDDAAVNARVHGHGPDGKQARGPAGERRLAYLPLPSIEQRGGLGQHVSDVLRVMVVAHPALAADLRDLEQRLYGAHLVDHNTKQPIAMLKAVPQWDAQLLRYRGPAATWATVTPVVLPGHDDPGGLRNKLRDVREADAQRRLLERLDRRVVGLLQKSLRDAGFPPELVAATRFEWHQFGFLRGVLPAGDFDLPAELTTPRLHVRVRFPVPVPGPLALGAGRFRGLGVFATDD